MPQHVNIGVICPGFVGSELIPEGVRGLAMSTDEFAGVILPQILAGEFCVISHSYIQVHVDNRYREISNAFSSYAPRHDGDDVYDVRVLLSKLGGP